MSSLFELDWEVEALKFVVVAVLPWLDLLVLQLEVGLRDWGNCLNIDRPGWMYYSPACILFAVVAAIKPETSI